MSELPGTHLEALNQFLTARTRDNRLSDADRLRCQGVVDSYRSGLARPEVESAMRHLAGRFADHPDYRYEWRPERQDPPPQWRLGHEDPGAEPADGLWGHPRRGKRATRHNPTQFSQRPLS